MGGGKVTLKLKTRSNQTDAGSVRNTNHGYGIWAIVRALKVWLHTKMTTQIPGIGKITPPKNL
jgi:hypothetical protein